MAGSGVRGDAAAAFVTSANVRGAAATVAARTHVCSSSGRGGGGATLLRRHAQLGSARGSAWVRSRGVATDCLLRAATTTTVAPSTSSRPERCARWLPMKMQKQQDTAWNSASVVENSEACEAHRLIVVNVGVTDETGSLIDSYRVPGQYVQMRPNADTKPGFFAISCAPNVQGYFEFLVKQSESAQWLMDIKAGDKVEVSPVGGPGFAITDKLNVGLAPNNEKPLDVLLFATGSGIAPIRACIESILNGLNPGSRRSCTLYYGCQYPERMAYKDRFPLWEEDGVRVVPVMSRPEKAPSGEKWSGETGYVQDVLKKEGVAAPKETGAILCGVKGMCQDVTQYLADQGVPKDRILLNF